MRTILTGIVSFVAAAVVPAAIVIGWYVHGTFSVAGADNDSYAWFRVRNFSMIALLFSNAHVLILGLPSFFLLRYLGTITWYSTIVVGFLLGCLPIGVMTWPLRHAASHSSSSSLSDGKMVDTLINGVPTLAGWMNWAEGMGFMGALGAIGGLSFWVVWRIGLRPNNSFKPNPLRGSA